MCTLQLPTSYHHAGGRSVRAKGSELTTRLTSLCLYRIVITVIIVIIIATFACASTSYPQLPRCALQCCCSLGHVGRWRAWQWWVPSTRCWQQQQWQQEEQERTGIVEWSTSTV